MPFKDFGLEVLTSADVNTNLMQQVIIRCTFSTRPASPTEGWHIYETDTQRFMVFKSGVWQPETELVTWVVKPADEVSSLTTFHDDADLVLPVAANVKYWLEGLLVHINPTVGFNIVFQWTLPAGASMRYSSNHLAGPTGSSGGNINKRFFTHTDVINVSSLNATNTTPFQGLVIVGSTAGNLRLQWRAPSGTLTMRKFSFMMLQPIG